MRGKPAKPSKSLWTRSGLAPGFPVGKKEKVASRFGLARFRFGQRRRYGKIAFFFPASSFRICFPVLYCNLFRGPRIDNTDFRGDSTDIGEDSKDIRVDNTEI